MGRQTKLGYRDPRMWVRIGSVTVGLLMSAMSGSATGLDITIGTGGVTGVYYPTGGAICRLVNRTRPEHQIRCSVATTDGSVANLTDLRAGSLEFAVAQADWQFHAFNGTRDFADQGAFEGLRAVFGLHPEPFTVVARADAGVAAFEDLRHKRVNVGNPGSGQRATMEVLLDEMGWGMEAFAQATELKAADQSQALCENAIDAMIYTVGHPSGAIQEATTACDSVLVEVANEAVFDLIEARPYYRSVLIPGGLYRGNPEDTLTFGVGAAVVTTANVPDEAVYALVKAVFENIDQFKSLHPAFANLDAREMASDGMMAPMHAGALRYFKEVGLVE